MHKKDTFRFKYFSVKQDLCAMKVGTDGVLLGAWANGSNASYMLDAGTGTGLLAFMLAQRFADCNIDAIDVDEKACEQAGSNVKNCTLPGIQNRVKVFESSLQSWIITTTKKYDTIVCNPPFFLNSFPVLNAERNKARVAENLTQEVLLHAAKKIVIDSGSLQVIYPVQEAESFLKACSENSFFCKRKTTVFSKENQPAKRMLLEIVKTECITLQDELVIEHAGRHNYTEEYKRLTKDFYLNF